MGLSWDSKARVISIHLQGCCPGHTPSWPNSPSVIVPRPTTLLWDTIRYHGWAISLRSQMKIWQWNVKYNLSLPACFNYNETRKGLTSSFISELFAELSLLATSGALIRFQLREVVLYNNTSRCFTKHHPIRMLNNQCFFLQKRILHVE